MPEENKSIYGDRVEESIEGESKDMFDEVFEEDEDEKAAKKKLAEKASELKKLKEKQVQKVEEKATDSISNKENEDDENEDEDDDEVEDTGNVEPVLFGEVGNEEKIEKERSKDNEEFDSNTDAFDAVDAGGKRPKKTETNFDEIVDDGLQNSIKKGEESIKKSGKGYGGKLDLKVTVDDSDEEDTVPTHPIEKNIIQSVIKNKAMMAAKEEVKVNRGVKINDNSPSKKKGETHEHEELAEALLREDGTREEGIDAPIVEEEEVEPKEEGKARMPKATNEEEETEESKDGAIKPDLEFLMSKEGHAYIGRKKSILMKYGEEAGLYVGRVNEKDKEGTDVYLDGLNPHVVFVCGARGSGKSYVLGVVAEELAIKNKNVGIVVVDPIGVFWSMKHPNKEEKELELLAKWGLMPRGLNNIKVFIPVGMKDSVPKSTYDAVFSIQPALLTAEDWCLTFGIDRFSPTGLLMEKGIIKVKSGYTTTDGKEVRGKQNTFSLDDLSKCFEFDAELNDREKGYKADSIRALVSRFDAAKHWGVFDDKGTSLGLLSRAGQMTILDTSFLEDNVGALVVGLISRRLLQARKLGTRREAAGKFENDDNPEDLVELNIPPTWLFIDEAHTLIPGGNQKTPASSALVEYVKQGRRPGCSLVFATQQPSAIDSRVLSQLDVIMAHKLVFDDDIKAISKRTPTIVPGPYKRSNFIKTMPVGIALTGDRSETTSRAFIMSIRPRMSQHEGRDAETTEVKQELEENQVETLAVNIVVRQLQKDPSIQLDSVKETLETLNNTYKKNVNLDSILKELEKKGIYAVDNAVYAPGVLEEMEAEKEAEAEEKAAQEELEGAEIEVDNKTIKVKKLGKEIEELEDKLHEFEEKVELTALQPKIDEVKARKMIAGHITKKFLFLDNEFLDRLTLKHAQIYKVKYKYFSHKEAFHVGEAYINSLTGEFIHEDRGNLVESKGLPVLLDLSEAETTVLKLVAEKKRNPKDVATFMRMEEGNAKRILDTLTKKGLIGTITDQKGHTSYVPDSKIEMDLPPTPLHEMLTSVGKMPITEVETAALVPPNFNEKEIPELLKKLWGNVAVKEVTHLFLPIWEGVLKKKTGEERIIIIDAINGKQLNFA
jgi:DNA helicase HerA-like ATPase